MNGYRELMRRKLLEEMYEKLSDEDKNLFVQLTIEDKDHREIMQAIQAQDKKLDDIHRSQSWFYDLSSNIVGNAFWDGTVFLVSKLLRKI